ncbi:zinc finger protein 271-like [Gadus chalcogrammus]|uniref:zinc finger protein 271-like n=1 Tax=Gadus chalcogrammus TaxID=1042646 RepID=UPI0024C2ED32|nr:zinc finger protein 271-like [Gadus chalcogrammus]
MLTNMSLCGPTLEEQLSSIIDVLAKAAVSEISQLFSEGSATLRLQTTRSLKENQALRMRMKVMRSELFSLRLQTRSNASSAAIRLALARANTCKPNDDCSDFGDRSTQRDAISETLNTPGSSHMSSHSEELRILSVYGKGEGPLALDCNGTLFNLSELEALNSLSADHSVAKSLERGEELVHREELTVQQTPDTILIKDEEDIGGGMPAVEGWAEFGDCSTQHSATLDSLHVDAPGSSHMSSHNGELRILSVYGKGEDPLAVDGHDNLFTGPEALSSLSVEHSVAKSLERGEQLVHREELTGHRGGGKDRPGVLSGEVCSHFHNGEKPYGCDQCTKRFQLKGSLKIHMRTHSGEKPYSCDQCVKRFSQSSDLKVHMWTHSREKPYWCDQCGKGFSKSSNMKIHMRTHSGEKPYRCVQCMRSFGRLSTLKSHLRTHSGEKPYSCDQCLRRFRQSSTLKYHMSTHSGEKP